MSPPAIEQGLAELHVPQSDAIVGAFIATLVLLPEAISAIKAALSPTELQRSLNIALGSALRNHRPDHPGGRGGEPPHRAWA